MRESSATHEQKLTGINKVRVPPFLERGGDAADLIRSFDWSTTPLGPIESWPAALRTAVGIMLQSNQPIRLAWGPDFTLLYNDAYRPILGSSKHPAAMGRSTRETFPEAWNVIAPMYERVVSGEALGFEDLLVPLDRHGHGVVEDCYFTFNYIPVRGESGSVDGVFVTARETTEKVLADQELRRQVAKTEQAERTLQSLITEAPVGIAALEGPDHVFTITNRAYMDLFFEGRTDFVGKTVDEAIPEARVQGFVDLLDRVYRTGETFEGKQVPVRLQRKDKESLHYVNFIYQALRDADGKVTGVVCVVYDVTEQIEARKKIEASEARYRSLAESMPELMWTASPDGQVTYANERCLAYTGLETEKKFGEGWTASVHAEDLPRVYRAWEQSMATGSVFTQEYRLRGHDKQYRWFLGRAVPVRADGSVQYWIGTATDIHEQKLAIEQLEQETQLREQFVATLTHDLRNPLAGAKLSAQLLGRSHDSPAKITSLSGRIVDNIDRANRMIENLLDASRIKVGEPLRLNKREAGLHSLVQETLDELSTTFGDRFILKAESTVINGVWDADAIRRIVENLCGNAIKYGAPDAPITVRLEDRIRDAVIQVHNAGNPIPEEEISTLFDPFRRAAAARAAGVKGWGLGLTLVKGFAEAHGGSVSVKSNAEEGTIFGVVLPKDVRESGRM